MREETPSQTRDRSVLVMSAVAGAIWGSAGYLLLWGHTPVVLSRSFVVSGAGTALLLPIRLSLRGIRFVEERIAGHAFDFSANNWWIGVLAALVGAVLVAAPVLVVQTVLRRRRRLRP